MWWVYILECEDRSYYVGVTSNVSRRFLEHELGQGSRYTKLHRPFVVRYQEMFNSFVLAGKREKQLKRWSRAKKYALICGDVPKLIQLSKSRKR